MQSKNNTTNKTRNCAMKMSIQEETENCENEYAAFFPQPTPANHKLYENVHKIITFVAKANSGHIITQQNLFRFQLSTSPDCRAYSEQISSSYPPGFDIHQCQEKQTKSSYR